MVNNQILHNFAVRNELIGRPNYMLYRFIIQNYRSFNRPVEFNLFPNNKRTSMMEHVYSSSLSPVLKTSAIYGSNGAGKSNFIKALLFIKEFTCDRIKINSNWFLHNRFLLKKDVDDSPISFLIEFSKNNIPFIYQVSIDENGIETESLYKSGLGKKQNEAIFNRHYEKVTYGKTTVVREISSLIERFLKSNRYASLLHFLTVNDILNNKDISSAFKWLSDDIEVLTLNYDIPGLISLLTHNKRMLEFVNMLFRQLSLGMNDVHIKSQTFDDWINKEGKEDLEAFQRDSGFPNVNKVDNLEAATNRAHLFSIESKNGKKMVQSFLFNQIGMNGYNRDMDVKAQSDGTLRLLSLIPAIYEIEEKESTLVIDEISNSIHPIIIRNLISFFCESNSKGQLIFTTHETELMRHRDILRPDEIWFVDKKEGESSMYSLNDFNFHKTMSILNGYMEGRFHAIPTDAPIVSK